MTDVQKALAAAREALVRANKSRQWEDTPLAALDAIDALDDLLEAIDAQKPYGRESVWLALTPYLRDGVGVEAADVAISAAQGVGRE